MHQAVSHELHRTLGGIGVSDQIAEVMESSGEPWMHAYTYSGHPVGAAVALANIDLLEQEKLVQQAQVAQDTVLLLEAGEPLVLGEGGLQ